MKNTELINYSEKMAKALRGNASYEPYHNNEIALVLEELRKQLIAQHEEYNKMLKAYLND
jgi:hypothetical protein